MKHYPKGYLPTQMRDVYVQMRLDDHFRVHSINLGHYTIHSINLVSGNGRVY